MAGTERLHTANWQKEQIPLPVIKVEIYSLPMLSTESCFCATLLQADLTRASPVGMRSLTIFWIFCRSFSFRSCLCRPLKGTAHIPQPAGRAGWYIICPAGAHFYTCRQTAGCAWPRRALIREFTGPYRCQDRFSSVSPLPYSGTMCELWPTYVNAHCHRSNIALGGKHCPNGHSLPDMRICTTSGLVLLLHDGLLGKPWCCWCKVHL